MTMNVEKTRSISADCLITCFKKENKIGIKECSRTKAEKY